MVEELTMGDPLQIAVIVFPLVALIVGFATDSIKETDSILYRIIVAMLGLGTFAPAISFFYIAVISTQTSINEGVLLMNLILASTLAFILTLAVLLQEVQRGLDDRDTIIVYGAAIIFLLGVGVVTSSF